MATTPSTYIIIFYEGYETIVVELVNKLKVTIKKYFSFLARVLFICWKTRRKKILIGTYDTYSSERRRNNGSYDFLRQDVDDQQGSQSEIGSFVS